MMDFIWNGLMWYQTGYRVDNHVLSVSCPRTDEFIGKLIKGETELSNLSIICYHGSQRNTRDVYRGQLKYHWTSQVVNKLIDGITASNLIPFKSDMRSEFIYFLWIELLCSPKLFTSNGSFFGEISHFSRHLKLVHGQEVYTMYNPFGIIEFFNSCSKGCLSNSLSGVLYIIDGLLQEGCEGAPVFTSAKYREQQYPIGLVIYALTVNNENSNYSLVVPLHVLADSLFKCEDPPLLATTQFAPRLLKDPHLHVPMVNSVIVHSYIGSGSGVIVGPGLVITNAHVTGFSTPTFPAVVVWQGHKVLAELIFSTDLSSHLDLAVLAFDFQKFSNLPHGVTFSSKPPEKGDCVTVIGYPLYRFRSAVVTRGIVTNVVKGSAGIITSCPTNGGSSGGPLVYDDGTLVGIVLGTLALNSKSCRNSNICIGSSVFRTLVAIYLRDRDVSVWNVLNSHVDHFLCSLISKY